MGSANPRGISIRFTLPDGTSTDIVGHSFDGFPTENPDQFRDLLLAIASSGPTAATPTALDRFLGSVERGGPGFWAVVAVTMVAIWTVAGAVK